MKLIYADLRVCIRYSYCKKSEIIRPSIQWQFVQKQLCMAGSSENAFYDVIFRGGALIGKPWPEILLTLV